MALSKGREEFLTGLPKCELHVHLEGTLEASMARAMAERHGLGGGEDEATRPSEFDGLADFLGRYYEAMDGLQEEDDFYELTAAYLSTAHRQGVTYAELFFDPQAHIERGISFGTVVRGIHRAQVEAREGAGTDSALICCFLRDAPVESAERVLDASLEFQDWIVGVGLDSDERGNPPAKFAALFERARRSGYRLTMHCDPRQESSLEHLWQCLDIGVERIDHGVECLADDSLVREIARRRLGLTVCPLSNLRLYGDLMGEAVREMLDRELLVTINSDDPAYFGGYVAENYHAIAECPGFSGEDLVQLARNSFEAAWLPPDVRQAHLGALEEYVAGAL